MRLRKNDMQQTTQFRILEMIPVVGIAAALTRSQSQNFAIISQLWKRFNREIHTIENRPRNGPDWKKYGITYFQKDEYCYLSGIPYTAAIKAPKQMQQRFIPSGRYACFTHSGPMYHLKTTVHEIYTTHLPAIGIERPSPEEGGLFHFECYDRRFHWNRADSCIDIYIPHTCYQEPHYD
jgi:predicted transcriptional regulator YdeE